MGASILHSVLRGENPGDVIQRGARDFSAEKIREKAAAINPQSNTTAV